MPPRYRVRFLREPPFAVRFGAHTWTITHEYYGKNGKRAALMARCSDGREIAVVDGRERVILHQLGRIETCPGTILYELWVRLARRGEVELVDRPCPARRPSGRYIDCGGGVFVPLATGVRARDLTWAQVCALCAKAAAQLKAQARADARPRT